MMAYHSVGICSYPTGHLPDFDGSNVRGPLMHTLEGIPFFKEASDFLKVVTSVALTFKSESFETRPESLLGSSSELNSSRITSLDAIVLTTCVRTLEVVL
jgi:hypothetical protein